MTARSCAMGANLNQQEGDLIAHMVLLLVAELTQGREPKPREATGTGYLAPDVLRHVMEASR